MYSDAPCVPAPKTFAEIDVGALKQNYRALCACAQKARRICVVKADAYGHTSAICVPALLEEGCDFFAVSSVEEAIAVKNICREAKKRADVLVLGYTDCSLAPLLSEHDIIQTVISEDHALELGSAASRWGVSVRVHIALNTGMNRIGLCAVSDEDCASASETVKRIYSFCESLSVEGLFTHFSLADADFELSDGREFTEAQFERFCSVRSRLLDDGIRLFCHVSNSAATIRFPEYALDGVRLGIALYGIAPSRYVSASVKPVMSLRTVVSHIQSVSAGERVGYGGEYLANKDITVATLPLGYGDGFLRAYSGFNLTVHTKSGDIKAPVIGRVCMDQCMVDVSGTDALVGDEVTVFGNDTTDISILARMAETIEYEVLCLVSARVPRAAKEKL
jgi:alanine racemase